jgi:hypothetical protein
VPATTSVSAEAPATKRSDGSRKGRTIGLEAQPMATPATLSAAWRAW